MTLAAISNAVALTLAILFLLAGAAHIIGPYPLRALYRRWQFARSFRYVAGTTQLLAALFLAVPQTRFWGGALAATILFTMVVSLLNHGKYLYAVPAILIMAAIVPAIAGPN
jgi:DoxX-like family